MSIVMVTYFISDLHLQGSCPETANLFFKFLATKAPTADAIYILGDFFELWVGDDADSIFLQKVKTVLAKLAAAKVPVFFMHGNRDFLVGKEFIKQTNCTMLPDPTVIELYGCKWLLSHGDSLIDDNSYKLFRYITRHPVIRYIFLCLPLKFRLGIAKKMRDNSQENYQKLVVSKPEALDVSQEMVVDLLKRYQIYRLIHGHTHQPKIHSFNISRSDGVVYTNRISSCDEAPAQESSGAYLPVCEQRTKPATLSRLEGRLVDAGEIAATRIVLGSWGKEAQILACSEDGYQLETI